MRSVIVVRRRKPSEKYMPSQRYAVEGWNDWGDGHYVEWFGTSMRTKAEAVAQARSCLLGNDNRHVVTTFDGFEPEPCKMDGKSMFPVPCTCR